MGPFDKGPFVPEKHNRYLRERQKYLNKTQRNARIRKEIYDMLDGNIRNKTDIAWEKDGNDNRDDEDAWKSLNALFIFASLEFFRRRILLYRWNRRQNRRMYTAISPTFERINI